MNFYVIILVTISIILILLKMVSPSKGSLGEKRVSNILKKLNKEYIVLNDITIKTNNGTSQIDHLIISPYGLFIIETKNFSGWIHGSENSEYWLQNIYKNKNKFRNPIKQNWAHVYTLKQILSDLNNVIYYPIVVFAGSAQLKNVYTTSSIIYYYQLLNKIYSLSNTKVLSKLEVDKISSIFKNEVIENNSIKRKHISDINTNIKIRHINEQNLICPNCNDHLILRNGKYGDFYGCVNYPKCRYILKKKMLTT